MKLTDRTIKENFGKFKKKKGPHGFIYELENGDRIASSLYYRFSANYFFKNSHTPDHSNKVEYWIDMMRIEINEKNHVSLIPLHKYNSAIWHKIDSEEAQRIKNETGASDDIISISHFPRKEIPKTEKDKLLEIISQGMPRKRH